MTTGNKETVWLLSNSEDISLKFMYIWMNGKNSKNYKNILFASSESNIPVKSQHLHSWYGAHCIIIKDWNTLDHAARW